MIPFHTNLSIVILSIVLLLIALRQVGRLKFRIWQAMSLGAIAVLLTGQISPIDAILAINVNVMVFLFGMFIVGQAMYTSGYLFLTAHRLFRNVRSVDRLVFTILIALGILAALLMNDTVAIIGTPLVLHYAKKFGVSPKLLLLALCFAITTGSGLSPIGNPQNVLIATYSRLDNPFLTFGVFLGIPTFLCLIVTYIVLKLLYRDEFRREILYYRDEWVTDPHLAKLAEVSIFILIALICTRSASVIYPFLNVVSLPIIAIIAAAPLLLFSPKRAMLVKSIDWSTLIFFATMFIVMASVWQSGFFQDLFAIQIIASIPLICTISVIISQFISNVPFVALFQPLLIRQGIPLAHVMALAAASTIAGNLTILGAASNVIVIQNAEKQGETLTFIDFLKAGLPLTFIQIAIFITFLTIF